MTETNVETTEVLFFSSSYSYARFHQIFAYTYKSSWERATDLNSKFHGFIFLLSLLGRSLFFFPTTRLTQRRTCLSAKTSNRIGIFFFSSLLHAAYKQQKITLYSDCRWTCLTYSMYSDFRCRWLLSFYSNLYCSTWEVAR